VINPIAIHGRVDGTDSAEWLAMIMSVSGMVCDTGHLYR